MTAQPDAAEAIDAMADKLRRNLGPSLQDSVQVDVMEEAIAFMRGLVADERERCARVAEAEPLPNGAMPVELQKCSRQMLAVASVVATIKCIAAAIRSRT